jgi:hypothetical protein
MPSDANDAAKLREMASGYMISQIIAVTAALGLADLLGDAIVSGNVLADATGIHCGSLLRLFHALTVFGLVEQPELGHFRLTARAPLHAAWATEALARVRVILSRSVIIRPTRGRIPISPHGGLYAMPSLCGSA